MEIVTKAGIERACLDENERKYRQTQYTPCMNNPLQHLLGLLGDTEICDRILDGTFVPPPSTDVYTTEFIKELKQHPNSSTGIALNVSPDDFSNGWKKMNEFTSSGISGMHFGHMKACASSPFLTEFESSISQIPFATGYSPQQWQQGVIVMIQKKAQVDLVSKLQILVLTEADFNYNNKLLGRRTLQHAETQKMIAKEQYGSRAGESVIDHAVHKQLTYDIMRQTRTNGALCSNNAMSCFDCIVHSVAILAYRRLGVPCPPLNCIFESIQNMTHSIQTSFGDSKWTVSSKGTLIPYQGILQGNRASPATWVVLSTPLLNMMQSAGHGGFFQAPISKEKFHFVGYAYVDDTDLVEFNNQDPNILIDEVMENIQSDIDRWEGGLKASGGALVPAKSWVYPISFKFDEEGAWAYESIDEIDTSITVKDNEDQRQNLVQKEPHVEPKIACSTIELWESPSRDFEIIPGSPVLMF